MKRFPSHSYSLSYSNSDNEKNTADIVMDGGFLGHHSVIFSEAFALRQGIVEAIRRGIPHLLIEGDNLQIVKAVLGDWSCPWEVELMRADIHSLLRSVGKA